MNTKLVMSAAAFLLAVIGISFSFFSAEIVAFTGIAISETYELVFQLLGALYFGFAMLNWMAKGSSIGGIYNRPIAIANFAHFFIGGMALLKAVISNPGHATALWLLAIAYALFALLFGYLLFFYTPVAAKKLSNANV